MKSTALIALLAIVTADDITPVDDARAKFYNIETGLWRNVTDPLWREAEFGGDVELTKIFAAFDNYIESSPVVPRPPLKFWLWNKVAEESQLIDGHYKHFVEFARRQSTPGTVPAPVREWLDLAEAVLLDPKVSVARSVNRIHKLLEQGEVVLYQLAVQEEASNVCTLQMSQHQLIYDMYNTVALTEIKGYAMMQFSWMLLRIYGRGNFTQEASLTRQRYGQRASQSAQVARDALAMANRDIYKCDPSLHVQGETYDQVTRLLQGYIENEVDMNPDGTCRENCAFYTLTSNYGCFRDQFCAKQTLCKGRIINCQYVDSDLMVCPASSRNSKRRYEWIEYENGKTLGKVGSCLRGTTKVDSWWRWLFWHCSYCMCLCDDATDSDRYFSLWDATSDVHNNKLVLYSSETRTLCS